MKPALHFRRVKREPGVRVPFVESIRTDQKVLEADLAGKVRPSPDFEGMDLHTAVKVVKARKKALRRCGASRAPQDNETRTAFPQKAINESYAGSRVSAASVRRFESPADARILNSNPTGGPAPCRPDR